MSASLNRHGVEMPGMTRTFHGDNRLSVEMSLEQHSTIYAALAVASTDSVLPLEVRHEYAALARLFGEAPIVGLTDYPTAKCDVHSTLFDDPKCTVCGTDTTE